MAASRQPGKNIGVLKEGVTREIVVAELGRPIITESTSGGRFDVFSFNNGYSSGFNASRAAVHAGADLMTLGLWEVVGTPTEALLQGRIKVVKVHYNNRDVIESVVYYSDK